MFQASAYVASVAMLASLTAYGLSFLQTTAHSQVVYRCPECRSAERCQRTEREAWSFHCNQCERDFSTWGAEPLPVQ